MREGEPELAEQLDRLLVRATCDCDEEGCRSVYLAPWPSAVGGEYRFVLPDAVVTVGVRDGRLESIEDYALAADEPNPARAAEFAALEGRVARATPVRDRATIRALVGALPVRPLGAGLDHRAYAVGDDSRRAFRRRTRRRGGAAARGRAPAAAAGARAGRRRRASRLPDPAARARDRAARPAARGPPPLRPQLLAFAAALHALDPPAEVPEDDTPPEAWRDEAHATWTLGARRGARRGPAGGVEAALADRRAPAPPSPAR